MRLGLEQRGSRLGLYSLSGVMGIDAGRVCRKEGAMVDAAIHRRVCRGGGDAGDGGEEGVFEKKESEQSASAGALGDAYLFGLHPPSLSRASCSSRFAIARELTQRRRVF